MNVASSKILSQYGKLQLFIVTRVLSFIIFVWILSLVVLAIIRVLTGVSIKRMGYMSVRHVTFRPRNGIEIRISKLALSIKRPSVVRPGWVSIAISGLEIEADPLQLMEADLRMRKAGATDDQHSLSSSTRSLFEQGVKSIPLLPKDRKYLAKLLRWIIIKLRAFELTIQSSTLSYTGLVSFIFSQATIGIDLGSLSRLESKKFVGTMHSYKLGPNETVSAVKATMQDLYIAKVGDSTPHHLLDYLAFDASGVLGIEDLALKELSFNLTLGKLSVNTRHVRDILTSVREMRDDIESHGRITRAMKREFYSNDEEDKRPDVFTTNSSVLSRREKERLARIGVSLLYLVKEIDIKAGGISFTSIEPPNKVVTTDEQPICYAFSTAEANFNVRRVNPESPSFKLLYDSDDSAHQVMVNISSVNLGIEIGEVQEEMLYIPTVSLVSRSNVASRTLRYIQDENAKFNDSRVMALFNIVSPNLNIETHHLQILMDTFLVRRSTKQRKHGRRPIEEPLIITLPFQNSLPSLDVSINVSHPALRIVVDCKEYPGSMLIASADSIQSKIKSKHIADKSCAGENTMYQLSSNVEVNTGVLWYRSESMKEYVISSAKSYRMEARAVTQPIVNVDISFQLSGISFAPARYELFHVFRSLYLSTQSNTTYMGIAEAVGDHDVAEKGGLLDDILKKQPSNRSHSPYEESPCIIRFLPPWLASLDCSLADIELVAASDHFRQQDEENLGLNLCIESLQLSYKRAISLKQRTYFTDGRLLEVRFNGIESNKVSNFNPNSGVHETKKKDEFMKISGLSLTLETDSKNSLPCSTLDISSKKIKFSYNINLLLSLMVIHEVLDHARGKAVHTDEVKIYEPSAHEVHSQRRKERLKITFHSDKVHVGLDLPKEDHILVTTKDLHTTFWMDEYPVINAEYIKLFSRHPFSRDAWCIIASISKLDTRILVSPDGKHGDIDVELTADKIGFNVPYRFQLYRIFDNSITLAKAVKTLVAQTKQSDPLLKFLPKQVTSLPKVPKMKVKSSSISLELEDDPFESTIGLIYRTARIELNSRIKLETVMGQCIRNAISVSGEKALKESLSQSHQKNKPESPFNKGARHWESETPASPARSSLHTKESKRHRSRTRKSRNTLLQHPESHEDSVPHYASRAGRELRSQLKLLESQNLDNISAMHNSSNTVWDGFFNAPEFEHFRKLPLELNEDSLPFMTNPEAMSEIKDKSKNAPLLGEVNERLVEYYSKSWIRTIRHAFDVQRKNVNDLRRERAFGENEESDDEKEDGIFVSYSRHPTLFSAELKDSVIGLENSHHKSIGELMKYLYVVGKRLPDDTKFSILVPLWLDIQARGGLQVAIRDFPLPVLHFPHLNPHNQSEEEYALRIVGNLVVTEQLVESIKNIRPLFVPLKFVPREQRKTRSLEVIEVNRTLAPIKIYTELQVTLHSNFPTRITYCAPYGPAFNAMGQGFSNFSKPPIDLSPVLPFWDKIRLIFHAKLNFDLKNSPLYLLLKGGTDPYQITESAAGFAFVWQDGVKVTINPDNDSRSLIKVASDRFKVVIPDYISWAHDYLVRAPAEQAEPTKFNFPAMRNSMKTVMDFKGGVDWTLGLQFERLVDDNDHTKRTGQFRDHFDVRLCMPEFTQDDKDYDAYRNFRSQFLYLSLAVSSRGQAANNGVHLTPGTVRHFKTWMKSFSSVYTPPQRMGALFPGAPPKKLKFSTALSGQQYQLRLSPLTLSYFYSSLDVCYADDSITGLKALVDSFTFDFHARKEPKAGNKRWRTNFHLGEVKAGPADIRVVNVKFNGNEDDIDDTASQSSFVNTAGESDVEQSAFIDDLPTVERRFKEIAHMAGREDSIWIDFNDYQEVGTLWNGNECYPNIAIEKFVSTPALSYYRQTDRNPEQEIAEHNGVKYKKFGDVSIHSCQITHDDVDDVQLHILKQRDDHLEKQLEELYASLDLQRDSFAKEHFGEEAVGRDASSINSEICLIKSSRDLLGKEMNLVRERLHKRSENAHNPGDSTAERNHPNDESENDGDDCSDYTDANSGSDQRGSGSPDEKPQKYGENSSENLDEDGTLYYSEFRNQFMIHSLHVKWNNHVRNILYGMVNLAQMSKETHYNEGQAAIRYLESLVENFEAKQNQQHARNSYEGVHSNSDSKDSMSFEQQNNNNKESMGPHDRIRQANDKHKMSPELTADIGLTDIRPTETLTKSFFVRIISPQCQIISDEAPDKSLQVLARDIDLKVLSVFQRQNQDDDNSARIERRYGVEMVDAAVMVFSREDLTRQYMSCVVDNYPDDTRSSEIWPIWLGPEFCYSPGYLKHFVVAQIPVMALRYDRLNALHVQAINDQADESTDSDATSTRSQQQQPQKQQRQSKKKSQDSSSRTSQFSLYFPRLNVSCDSIQYYTVYTIGTDLFSYVDPNQQQIEKAIERAVLGTDFTSDMKKSLWHIKSLKSDLIILAAMRQHLLIHRELERESNSVSLLDIELEHRKGTLDLFFMVRAFKTVLRKCYCSGTASAFTVNVFAGDFVLNLLNAAGRPFMRLKLDDVMLSRINKGEQWTYNNLEINDMQAQNLVKNAVYPEIISSHPKYPLASDENVVQMKWTNLAPVGGITILEDFALDLKPIKVQIERDLIDKIFQFIFPDNNKSAASVSDWKASSKNMRERRSSSNLRDQHSEDENGESVISVGRHSRRNISVDHDSSSVISSGSTQSVADSETTANSSTKRSHHHGWGLRKFINRVNDKHGDDVTEMIDRAANFLSIVEFVVHDTKLSVSYKGRSRINLLDLQEVDIPVPTLTYQHKLWTKVDLMMHIRSDFIKIALSNLDTIVGNKFVPHYKAKKAPETPQEVSIFDSMSPIRPVSSRLSRKLSISLQTPQGLLTTADLALFPKHQMHYHEQGEDDSEQLATQTQVFNKDSYDDERSLNSERGPPKPSIIKRIRKAL